MAVFVQVAAGGELAACAVLTIEAKGGLSAEEASLLSDRLAVELGNSRLYKVVDRQKVKEMLTERVSIGPIADMDAGVIESGRFLQARYVVHGSLGKVGSLWTMNIYVVDVETALRVKQVVVDLEGSKEDVFAEFCRKVVQKFGGEVARGGKGGGRIIEFGDGTALEMVWIPSAGVWMGVYEVTCGQYQAFLRQSGYDGRKDADRAYLKHLRGKDDTPSETNYPVVWVSYENAEAFCKWLGEKAGATCRLPTEREWETACCGNVSASYAWGADVDRAGDYAWFSGNATGLMPVGGRKPTGAGLYDMAGNVWEYCSGWYDIDKRSHPVRGGSWFGDASYLAVGAKQPFKIRQTWNNVGFRVVLCP